MLLIMDFKRPELLWLGEISGYVSGQTAPDAAKDASIHRTLDAFRDLQLRIVARDETLCSEIDTVIRCLAADEGGERGSE